MLSKNIKIMSLTHLEQSIGMRKNYV